MLTQKDWFPPIAGVAPSPLQQVLQQRLAPPDAQLLVAERPEGKISALVTQMAWAHVAQGELGGKPWLITF